MPYYGFGGLGIWGDAFFSTGNIGFLLLGNRVLGDEDETNGENPLFR